MSYTAPTVEEIRTRFPEFTEALVGNDRMAAVILEAQRWVDTSWIEADYNPALKYLTAHILASEGALRPAQLVPLSEGVGPVTSERLGDASVSYGSAGGSSSGSSRSAWLQTTQYGRSFYQIMKRNFGGPVVIQA